MILGRENIIFAITINKIGNEDVKADFEISLLTFI